MSAPLNAATNLVLVFQSVGAFVTPWLGNLFGLVSGDLKMQFFMSAVCFGTLTAAVGLFAKSGKKALDLERTL